MLMARDNLERVARWFNPSPGHQHHPILLVNDPANARPFSKQFEFDLMRWDTYVCLPRLRAVASRHSLLPGKNGPLLYVNSAKVGEEKVRLGEGAMGWCRKDKLQRFRFYLPRYLAAYPVPAFSRRTDRHDCVMGLDS
jgi:hypothetical protein